MKIIARIENDYTEKFGVPRQSGLTEDVLSRIVFLPEYRVKEAFRGIEEYSHLWLIWGFSENADKPWSPTVRPPKLGGNIRKGVFATRSPFRPNPIGLSAVKLVRVDPEAEDGAILTVSGADLMNGTPIYDIKPYLPYADSHPEAQGSFGEAIKDVRLTVVIPESILARIPEDKQAGLRESLALDPRPGYQHDDAREYGIAYGGFNIRFIVSGEVLTVFAAEKQQEE